MSAPLWVLMAYVLGAVPASYVAGRLRGIDLRQHGSKNLGATNVYRLLGWGYAVPVGLFDVGKGAAAVGVLGRWAHGPDWLPVALGAAAVVGHVFSPFVGFRGGKGVATAAGMFLALAPLAVLIAVPVWAVCLWLTGYVSLSSIVAAASFPVWVRLTAAGSGPTLVASIALAAMILYTHRSNMRRLVAGTEHRFGRAGGRVGGRAGASGTAARPPARPPNRS